MSAEIAVYEMGGFGSVRIIVEDGEFIAVASDLAHMLAYREARDMLRSLDEDEKGLRTVQTAGGPQRMSVVTEPGIYHAISMRRPGFVKDPEMRARVEAFQRWLSHDLVPTLRRDGVYMNVAPDQLGDAAFDRLMSYTMAALNARLQAAEAKVEEMRPKAELGEAVSATPDTIDWARMANLLTNAGFRIGRNNLLKLLREEKILKSGEESKNLPYQRYIDKGYFEVHESSFEKSDGSTHVTLTTRVTGRGQAFLLNRYACARTLAVDVDG